MFNARKIRRTVAAAGVATAALTPAVVASAAQQEPDAAPAGSRALDARALLVEPGPLGLTAELRKLAATRHTLVHRNLDVVRRVAKLKQQPGLVRTHRRKLRHWSNDAIRGNTRKLSRFEDTLRDQARARRRAAQAGAASAGGGASSTGGAPVAGGALESIAACESGGDPSAIGGGGAYRGKYQFDQSTWESVGGTGDPAAAPEAVQDEMAARLYAQRGSAPWPNCG